jgi:signal transduction histidine kinase
VLFLQNIYAQSKVLDSLKKGIETHTMKDTVRINYLISIGKYIVRTEKEKVLQYGHEAVDIAEELKIPSTQIKSYIHLGKLYNMQNRYISAINYYQKAMVLCEQTRDTIDLAEIYFGLATIYRYQERYEKAEQYNKRALAILNHSKYDGLKAKIYNNMGILYDRQKNYAQAIEYYEKSLAIKEKLKDTLGMPITLSNLAIIYSYQGNFRNDIKAQEYIEKARKIAYKLNDNHIIKYSTLYLSRIQLENKNYEKALSYSEESLNLYKDGKYDDIYIEALIVIGEIYYTTQKYTEALKYVNSAIEQNKTIKNHDREKEAYQLLAKIYEAQGNFREALRYKEKESIIKDTIFAQYRKQEATLAENDYELFHFEQTNQKLKSLNELQKERLRKQGITIAFVVVAFTLASILTILLVYANSSRNHYFKELENRNQVISEINAELQKNNEVKSKLFSIISHDLRSPLATTKGLLMLLKDEPNLSEEFKIYLNQMSKNLDSTFILLDNLLKWSATQMQSVKFKPAPFFVLGLIQEIQEIYTPMAQEKKIELITNIPQDYKVFADRDMLHLVLRNLISNAVKFTPDNGKIEIGVQKQDTVVQIFVKDTGVGIPKEHIGKIFEGFSTRGTASEKGTGLGLQLCKEFVTLNNGKLNVESKENEGSIFSFTVPLAQT